MLPITPCNTAGFRIILGIAALMAAWQILSPTPLWSLWGWKDDAMHVAAFLLISFLVDASWPEVPFFWRKLIPLSIIASVMEAAQYFIPHRIFELTDMYAYWGGIALYMLLHPLLAYLLRGKIRIND